VQLQALLASGSTPDVLLDQAELRARQQAADKAQAALLNPPEPPASPLLPPRNVTIDRC
jgi:hypothetical protein